MQEEIFEHNMAEIQGLNQRGGRMLSIVDLIERGTIDIDIAAFLLSKIHGGASFLCCALQGGVGKTTLMGALLGLLPPGERIETVASAGDVGALGQNTSAERKKCLVVHEIGPGSWHGYLWGKPVLEYLALKDAATRIVSNIHADTLDEVEGQIRSFGGSRADLLAFDIVLFISLGKERVAGEQKRIVQDVMVADRTPGKEGFRGLGRHVTRDRVDPRQSRAREALQALLDGKIHHVDEVTCQLVRFHENEHRGAAVACQG